VAGMGPGPRVRSTETAAASAVGASAVAIGGKRSRSWLASVGKPSLAGGRGVSKTAFTAGVRLAAASKPSAK